MVNEFIRPFRQSISLTKLFIGQLIYVQVFAFSGLPRQRHVAIVTWRHFIAGVSDQWMHN
jgi:hypothetical protein